MIEPSQELPTRSRRDKIDVTPWVFNIIWAIGAPFEFLAGLAVVKFVRTFSGAIQNGQRDGFDDPVYKKNLQRLIERNRQFEEERNERHS
jgi:hypothetical protein